LERILNNLIENSHGKHSWSLLHVAED
jgi:hypothetical protein